jgi:hypothetical protein
VLLIAILGLVVAFVLSLGYVHLSRWWKDSHTTRFFFEDRDTYLLLKVEQVVGNGPGDLVAMMALREALRLKLTGVGFERLMVHLTGLKISNSRAFWFLMGALAPAFGAEKVKVAMVCAPRSQAAKGFRESGLLAPFPTIRQAEAYLWSDEPRTRLMLDKGQLDALLDRGHTRAA